MQKYNITTNQDETPVSCLKANFSETDLTYFLKLVLLQVQ